MVVGRGGNTDGDSTMRLHSTLSSHQDNMSGCFIKHILWVLNEAVVTCTHNICCEQKYENIQNFQLKIVIFTAVKNRGILHGPVFVMTQQAKNMGPIWALDG